MENILYIYWKDPSTRQRFKVGRIVKKEAFEFKYENDISIAIDKGFKPFFPFIDTNKVYKSAELFPAFLSRLPDPKRKDISSILQKYGLERYDPFELLKKSEGRLPIDTLEFIEPIDLSGQVIKDFYIAGVSHGDMCDGTDCDRVNCLQISDFLKLVPEPNNRYDSNAIKICHDKTKIGYVPVYYSEAIHTALSSGRETTCQIVELNTDKKVRAYNINCQECVKVRIIIK
jgi:hypothetical protein